MRGYQKTALPCSLTTEYTFNKYVAVIAGIAGEQRFPGDAPKAGLSLVGRIPELLSGRAMTDNGDNDTSAAKARSAEYPAMVKVQ